MANEKLEQALAEIKKLDWANLNIPAKQPSLKVAVCEIDGIAFMFTEEFRICIMCDVNGMYSAKDIAGVAKKYGNHCDFADSICLATLRDCDLETSAPEMVREELENAGTTIANTLAAKPLEGKDWKAIAAQLEPYYLAVQALNIITEVKMC